jgi:Bacterial conjugation TrbI-like protein
MGVVSIGLLLLTWQFQSAVVPAGTGLDAKLESSVKTGSSEVGDDVAAVVADPVLAAGRVAVPRGARLRGRVETVQAATPAAEGRVRLVFREIELPDGRHLSTWITNSFGASPPKRTLRYMLYMGAGGLAGGLIGGKTARLAGILGGTLAGFVIAGSGQDSNLPNLTLHSGQKIHLQLNEELRIPDQ